MTVAPDIRPRVAAGQSATPNLPIGCRCGARWSGLRTAHCAGTCHRTFSGETAFNRHRRNGQCLDPTEIGMSLVPGRAFECWGYPGAAETDTTETTEDGAE